ncbi:toprim domain-containing protein [Salmonella enterica]|nr:toprim domain-containing protein [Salmonella enterica]EKK6596289.1 toprim domain-containing protein [Salmonella enterica]
MTDNTLSIADLKEQFRRAMAADGIICDDTEIVDDGQVHRFDVRGDRKGRRNGWYIFHSDHHVNASYGCHKRYPDEMRQWAPDGVKVTLSPEQRAQREAYLAQKRIEREEEEAKRHAKAQRKAQEKWQNAVPCTEHEYTSAKGIKPLEARTGPWEIWDQDERRYVEITKNALLIPLMDNKKVIHSIQAIIPAADLPEGDINGKKLLPGGAKRGLFCPIGRPQLVDRKTVYVLCEGYATGVSIHEATGHMVLVCFDNGNLPTIAKIMAESLAARGQESIVIIAADNDEWTPKNPGVKKAKEAAELVGGLVAIPQFESKVGKPTDFNDLHNREGLDAVRRIFDLTLNPRAEEPKPAEPESVKAQMEAVDPLIVPDSFAILGYTGDSFVFYQHEQKQVKFIGQTNFSEATLLNLAPLEWWEYHFPHSKTGYDKKNAVNWINRSANRIGFFDAKRIRGRGAWIDSGRVVFHHGDRLTVDGIQVDLSHLESSFIYPRRPNMPSFHDSPLTAAEGQWLLSIANRFCWCRPASGPMCVGWAFLAPLCGALQWRPHTWITGGAGSGKTAVFTDFVIPMVSGFCEFVQGASSEAGIRQELGSDALPVMMDEAETNTKRESSRMESILALVRQASSESQARTLRGTAGGQSLQYLIRSMFGLASINTNLSKQADADRLTRLELLSPKHRKQTPEEWAALEEELHLVKNFDHLSARMVTRAVSMWKMLSETISIFRRIGARFFGSQRKADQYGTLMAGAWCVTNDTIPTDEACMANLESYNWDEHLEGDERDDALGALEVVMTSVVKTKFGDQQIQQLVKSLISDAPAIERPVCYEALLASGIRIDKTQTYLCFAPSHPVLAKLVADQPFANDLRGQLKRIPGADVFDNKNVRFGMLSKKVVRIPLEMFRDE